MEPPTLNFAKFSGLDNSERKDLAGRMIGSFSRHGAVRLINHGIPAEVLSPVFPVGKMTSRLRIPSVTSKGDAYNCDRAEYIDLNVKKYISKLD